jgi:phosphoribosylpyrophosphate synthetase
MGQQHKVAHLYPITFENHQYSNLNVVQIAVINSEYRSVFEKSLLNKAKKQQDLVVVSYDSEGTTKVLYEPKTNYEIDRIEVNVGAVVAVGLL